MEKYLKQSNELQFIARKNEFVFLFVWFPLDFLRIFFLFFFSFYENKK